MFFPGCPYFARVELLADRLALNLPEFKLHKIVKLPEEWEEWLATECQHKKSPLVWRELVNRGGKGMLIGGANEFQEYAHGYYGIMSDLNSDDMINVVYSVMATFGDSTGGTEEVEIEAADLEEKIQPLDKILEDDEEDLFNQTRKKENERNARNEEEEEADEEQDEAEEEAEEEEGAEAISIM